MQGRIVTSQDYTTTRNLRLIKLRPTAPGEARTFAKLRQSGLRSIDLRFSDDSKDMVLVIPEHVDALPDSIGRGSRGRYK